MATKKELEASNLTLLATLNEAIECYETALTENKSGHLIERDGDNAKLAELREIVETHRKHSSRIFKQIQSDTVASLQFPTMLRKMWSGGEVQQWLNETAESLKK